jgi:hypothetical protein
MPKEQGFYDFLTTSPDFIKRKVKAAHESIESPSLFDSPLEKYGKPALHAAIDTADTYATPLDAAGLLAGGAGFAGAKIADRLRKLPKVSNMSHYVDAIKLGKTHPEAVKIASSGGKTAADRARIASEIEAQFKVPKPKTKPTPKATQNLGHYADQTKNLYKLPPEELARYTSQIKQTSGKGKSVIDLAESVRRNTRRPYFGR